MVLIKPSKGPNIGKFSFNEHNIVFPIKTYKFESKNIYLISIMF